MNKSSWIDAFSNVTGKMLALNDGDDIYISTTLKEYLGVCDSLYSTECFFEAHLPYADREALKGVENGVAIVKTHVLGIEKKEMNSILINSSSTVGTVLSFEPEILDDIESFGVSFGKKIISELNIDSFSLLEILEDMPFPVYFRDLSGKLLFRNSALRGLSKKLVNCKNGKMPTSENDRLKMNFILDKFTRELARIDGEYAGYLSKKFPGGIVKDDEIEMKKDSLVVDKFDGMEVELQVFKRPILGVNDEIKGIVGMLQDVSDVNKFKRKTEHLLKIKDKVMELSEAAMTVDDMAKLLESILDAAISSVHNAKVGKLLVIDKNKKLMVKTHRGYKFSDAGNFRIDLEESIYVKKQNVNCKDVIIVNDATSEGFKTLNKTQYGEEIKSLIIAPVVVGRKLYGFLNIDSPIVEAFGEADKEIIGYMKEQIERVIKRYNLFNEIVSLSRFDKLTGVANRSYFEELFNKYYKNHISKNKSFSVAIIDLDELKLINDTHGHYAGDKLLKVFTKSIVRDLNENADIFARLGGDEFILVTDKMDDIQVKQKLQDILSTNSMNLIKHNGRELTCKFSFGVSMYPKDSKEKSELIKMADEKMYIYKNKKRL